jgi:O-antigen/teichoic acid export membrane protein
LQILSRSRLTLIAIADQVLWSLGTFLIAVFVGRFLGTSGLGTFSLGMAVITGIGSAYNSLVVAPAAHLGPTAYPTRLREYSGRLIQVTLLPGMVLTLLAAIFGFTIQMSEAWLGLIVAIGATPIVLAAWLSRRINYIEGRPAAALVGTSIYSLTAVGVIVWLGASDKLTVVTAFAALGLASLCQLIVSALISRVSFIARHSHPLLGEIASKHWGYGRWLLAAAMATWVGNEGYTVVLASAVIDVAAVGGLRAATNLTRGTGIFFEALSLLFVPRLSADWQSGKVQTFLRSLSAIRWAFLLVPTLATAASILWGEWILVGLYGPSFSGIELLLTLLMAGMIFNGSAEADGIGLASIGETRGVFLAHAARAIAAPVIGLTTGLPFGIYGVLAGYLAGQGLKAIVMRREFKRLIRRLPASAQVPLSPSSNQPPPK